MLHFYLALPEQGGRIALGGAEPRICTQDHLRFVSIPSHGGRGKGKVVKSLHLGCEQKESKDQAIVTSKHPVRAIHEGPSAQGFWQLHCTILSFATGAERATRCSPLTLLPGFPILSPPHSDRFQAPAQNPRQAPKLWKAPASPGLTSIAEGGLCFQQHIRASCSHPTPAGALLSTEVPKLHAPCFHPIFFPPLILGLTWKLSCRSQLCQRVFHSHTATTPRSTLGF